MVSLSERFSNYKKQVQNYIYNREIKNFNKICEKENKFKDFSKHTIISGEPRGGTTWLMELLMNEKDCIIWEPLHYKYLGAYNKGFLNQVGHMPYIPENQEWAEAKEYFMKLFGGQLPYGMNVNFQYKNNPLKENRNLLIKFCRANMLLPWLNSQFPEIRPIYLIRHPLSVISSQFRHSSFNEVGTLHNLFEVRKNGIPRFSDIFDKYEDKISKIKSRESMYANWWAIQNLLPLKSQNRNWITVSYESLFLNPLNELERIAHHLNTEVSNFNTENINNPSKTTKEGSGILENRNQLSNFKRHLSSEQIKEILDIIHSYGIDCYSDELEPRYDKLGY